MGLRWGFEGVSKGARFFCLFSPNQRRSRGSRQGIERLAFLMLLEQKLAPGIQALAGLGGRLKYPRFGSNAPDVGQRRVAVVVARLGEIDLADENHIRRLDRKSVAEGKR